MGYKFNIIGAINSQSKLLIRFGGHPRAAGFTVSTESIEQFRDNLLEITDRELSDEDVYKQQIVDCEIKVGDMNWELLERIERFAPFGFKNSKPRFILQNVDLSGVRQVGEGGKHLQCATLNKKTGEYFKCIGFGLGEEWGDLKTDQKVDLLFSLEMNEWNGTKNLQLNIRDIRLLP